MGFGVRELDGADPTEVVEVSRELRVAGAVGERGLADELVGLLIKIVVEVVSQ